ncbi:MAG: BlaI/MecI/CopY family transcriptional regulator [Pseudonocardia sp.]
MGERRGVDTRLGELEAVIMDRVWNGGPSATVRDMLEQLQTERSIAYTTVMTVMDNLHRKGWLLRELDGRAWRYRPAADRDEYTATLLAEVLASTDDQEGALLRFVERMSASEATALREALRRVSRKSSNR